MGHFCHILKGSNYNYPVNAIRILFFSLRSESHVSIGSKGMSMSPLKGKAIQLQALTSPEGSRRFRLADLKTIGT
jgi:hypothetical protein